MKVEKNKNVIGKKQTQRALSKDEAASIYVAEDADKKVVNDIIEISNEKKIEVVYVDTMENLGKMFGIDVKAAVAATLK
ncbi:MAG: ribosomal L7Ae/L30e/S12e/Gadd45 family protein [Bacillota bacterium]|nr:ribosomal L7Ae/L30e/S12e/Gadd45 family protein [Bacillota bacterium]